MEKINEYKKIADMVTEAVKDIKDESLKKIAFERFLENELSGGEPTVRKKRPRRKIRKRVSKKPVSRKIREEVEKLELSADEKGLVPWKELKLEWHKYLWILQAAKKRDIDGLTNAEIAYLITERLRDKSDETSTGNLRFKVREGYVTPTKIGGRVGYKIMRKGMEQVTRGTKIQS